MTITLQKFDPTTNEKVRYDFTQYNVNIEGPGGLTTITAYDLLYSEVPVPVTPKLWVFILILGVLILFALGCFAYGRSKSGKKDQVEENEADEVYKTMENAKEGDALGSGTQFETGLNPNEEEDGLN
jgi:hypothetical protein